MAAAVGDTRLQLQFRAVILGKKLPLRGKGAQSKHSLRNRAISLRGGTKSYEIIILYSPASVEPSHNVVAALLCRGALRKEAI
jgi:hypothetical protein